MNAGYLFQRIEQAQGSIADLQTALEDAKRSGDPFMAFFFEARRSHRHWVEHDGKSGKRLRENLHASYAKAREYGFKGDVAAWASLLSARIPVVESPRQQ